MSSSAKREMYRRSRTHTLELFCSDFEMTMDTLNRGYQLRVENLVDFYPVKGRYCILKTGERGDWDTAQDLRRVMLKALDKPSQNLVDNWAGVDKITLRPKTEAKPKSPTLTFMSRSRNKLPVLRSRWTMLRWCRYLMAPHVWIMNWRISGMVKYLRFLMASASEPFSHSSRTT